MNGAVIVQQPGPAAAVPPELLLLFHGVGSSAEDLRPLGQALAGQRPQAWIVSVPAAHPSDFGTGRQWFSVQGVTEANRPQRVAAAMPAFLQAIAGWQGRSGATPAATTLIGFSQGAIMALEATQLVEPPAGRVVAIAGRFAQPARVAPAGTVVHLLHGEDDRVMPAGLAADALAQLRALGTRATLDVFPGLGHGIDARVVQRLAQHLGEPGAVPPATSPPRPR